MFIEFRVENHRSLRDEQVLTLEAGGRGEPSDPRARLVPGSSKKLLTASAIYGANASGKSNVLDAFAFMQDAVLYSHRNWEPDGGVPRTPFAWGEERQKPSLFEVSFLFEEIKYTYGFVAGDEAIEEEWLFAWPNGRKQVWFERDGKKFTFGDHLSGPNKSVREITRPNALFLSVASQNNHEGLLPIYLWFRNIATLNIQGQRRDRFQPSGLMYERLFQSDNQLSLFPETDSEDVLEDHIRKLLSAADLGIVDVKTKVVEEEYLGRSLRRRRTLLQHQQDDEDSWLDLEEESDGTKALFRMASPIFNALNSGGLLLVDELESSLHPKLGLAIIRMFNCPNTNPNHAQIIFTTHDTNLLGTTLGSPPLRRDQIWFTEKDKEGATKLYPLTDYKPRKVENLERGYLQGRYGAIPFLGDLSRVTE